MRFSVVIASVFLVACDSGKEDKKFSAATAADKLAVDGVVGIAAIEPDERIVQLTTESGGIVKSIHIRVGQQVKKGDLLFSLTDDVEQAQVAQALSKLHTQQSIIEGQRATLASFEVQLENARTNFERNQKLFEGNAATQQQLDDSRFAFQNITQQKAAAASSLQQQFAKKEELRADLKYYESLLGRKHIRSPRNGTILSIDTRVGNFVKSETVLGEFAPEGGLVAITEIDELFADRVKLGQHATLRPQGDSILLGEGKVVILSPYLKKKSLFSDNTSNLEDRRVREVRVRINPEASLLIGSRVECVIEVRQ